MSKKSTVELLNEYIERHMRRDPVTGLYPDDQVKKLNEYFHSLPDVKLYHSSPKGDIKELRVGFKGKSGVLNEVYASPEESFVYAFAIHNHEEKSFIDTSKHSMDFCMSNVDAVKKDNKGCYIYEITTSHTEFSVNPNSKFGAFEVTCPHSVKVKPPVYKDNLLKRMSAKWNFYNPLPNDFYAGILATGEKLRGSLTTEEFNTMRGIFLTSEKQKISFHDLYTKEHPYNFSFDVDKIKHQYHNFYQYTKFAVAAQKSISFESKNPIIYQSKNRMMLKKLAISSNLSFDSDEAKATITYLYSSKAYGKPQNFLAAFPNMNDKTKTEILSQLCCKTQQVKLVGNEKQ